MPENYPEIVAHWNRGEFSAREAARMLGVSRSTFFRRVREDFRRSAKAESDKPVPAAGAETAPAAHQPSPAERGTHDANAPDVMENGPEKLLLQQESPLPVEEGVKLSRRRQNKKARSRQKNRPTKMSGRQ